MKYPNDMYPVCNDAEHGDCWLFILRVTVASCLVLCTLKVRLFRLPKLIIAMKSAVNFPTELTLAGNRV